ncbi:MAG TPA: diaminopimelate decarboxylase [Candidatus Sulfotelmatobacter sp.]|nr:diaminopimelate decarboxylase [Candidatus Sulfotelmatobacter sp.]
MQIIHEPLENRAGELYFDGISALELAKKYDTPLYIISEKRIKENYGRLRVALTSNYENTRIYYAAKANSNMSALRILENAGAYIDAVSPGEVSVALASGFSPDRIMFTGTSVRTDELEFLINSNVTINIDSLSQLNRLLNLQVPEILSVRVNPEVGAGLHNHVITAGKQSKFGLWETDVLQAYETAKKAGVRRFGIQMHVGSGVLNVEPFVQALEKMLNIAKKVHNEIDIEFEFVDIGGGLGVPYKPEDKELDLTVFSDRVLGAFKNHIEKDELGNPVFCVEPGRYLVADASILLTTVNTIKITPYKKFIGVDAGFNTLVRPTMYGSYHHIAVANKLNAPDELIYDVVGPICESGDALAKDRCLPIVQEGDLLAVLDAGAYGYSMSSQYNLRPRAAEVLIACGKDKLVRKREQFDDLVKGQCMVE